jgi:hypothetical protein
MSIIVDFDKLPRMSLILSSVSLLIVLILHLIRSKKTKKPAPAPKQYPDGPRPLPFLGTIFAFSALKNRPDQELLRIAQKYGSICMLWFGHSPVIIVSSPRVAKELMDKVHHQTPCVKS